MRRKVSIMVTTNNAMLQAANLRVNYTERNLEAIAFQIMNITDIEEARDIILALTVTAGKPVESLRQMLAAGY